MLFGAAVAFALESAIAVPWLALALEAASALADDGPSYYFKLEKKVGVCNCLAAQNKICLSDYKDKFSVLVSNLL